MLTAEGADGRSACSRSTSCKGLGTAQYGLWPPSPPVGGFVQTPWFRHLISPGETLGLMLLVFSALAREHASWVPTPTA